MMKIITILTALLFNCVTGVALGGFVGIDPILGAIGMNGVSAVVSLLPMETGIMKAGVFRELWTGEMVKTLRGGLDGSWLDGIPDATSAVNNDVIHLVDVGVDPDVLINNTTYPIPTQELPDGDIAITLDKLQTKVTPITDDELYASSHDKMQRVKDSHAAAINEAKYRKSAHAFCADSHTEKTPIIKTTGEIDALTGRKRMTKQDLLDAKVAMDKLRVPAVGRRLVLCPDHINDILGWSEAFQRQYNMDNVNGKVGRLFGFDIYEFNDTPVYTSAGAKKALGATAETGEFQCSFAFYTQRVFKATGSTKVYLREAATDPDSQQNKINYRHYFIAMPKKKDAGVTICSGYTAVG